MTQSQCGMAPTASGLAPTACMSHGVGANPNAVGAAPHGDGVPQLVLIFVRCFTMYVITTIISWLES